MKTEALNNSKRFESSTSVFKTPISKNILLLWRSVLIVISLAYLYGFIIIWTAYGNLGVIPVWFPVYLYLPPGLSFIIIAAAFIFAGILFEGFEGTLLDKETNKKVLSSITQFTITFISFGVFLFEQGTYFPNLKQPIVSLLITLTGICFTYLLIINPKGKIRYILDVVIVMFIVVIHIFNWNPVMRNFFMFCCLVYFLGIVYFAPQRFNGEKLTAVDKLSHPVWLGITAIVLIISAGYYGNKFYFSVSTTFGGGRCSNSLLLVDKNDWVTNFCSPILEVDSIITNSDETAIEGKLLGQSSDLYFIMVKPDSARPQIVALKHESVNAMIFNYKHPTASDDTSKESSR